MERVTVSISNESFITFIQPAVMPSPPQTLALHKKTIVDSAGYKGITKIISKCYGKEENNSDSSVKCSQNHLEIWGWTIFCETQPQQSLVLHHHLAHPLCRQAPTPLLRFSFEVFFPRALSSERLNHIWLTLLSDPMSAKDLYLLFFRIK